MKFRYSSVKLDTTPLTSDITPSCVREHFDEIKRPISPTDVVVAALFPDSPRSPGTPTYPIHDIIPQMAIARQSISQDTTKVYAKNTSLDFDILSRQQSATDPLPVRHSIPRKSLSSSYKQTRAISNATTTASFEEWYDNNPYWPTFRDVDIHAVWDGNSNSPVELDIRLQILAQAGEPQKIFHHAHETVQSWSLVSAEPDPHTLYFRTFKDHRDSSAALRLDQWLAEPIDTVDTLSLPEYIAPPPSYSTVAIPKTRRTSDQEPKKKKTHYLRKRSTQGKLSQRQSSTSSLSTRDDLLTDTSPTHLILSTASHTRARIHIKAKVSLVASPQGGHQLRIPGLPVFPAPDLPQCVLHLKLPDRSFKEVCVYDDLVEGPVRVEAPRSDIEVPVTRQFEVWFFKLGDLVRPVASHLPLLEEVYDDVVALEGIFAREAEKKKEKKKEKCSRGGWWAVLLLFLFLCWVFARAFAHGAVVGVEGDVARWVVRVVGSDAPVAVGGGVPARPTEEKGEEDEGEEERPDGPVTLRDHVDWWLGWKGPRGEWPGRYY